MDAKSTAADRSDLRVFSVLEDPPAAPGQAGYIKRHLTIIPNPENTPLTHGRSRVDLQPPFQRNGRLPGKTGDQIAVPGDLAGPFQAAFSFTLIQVPLGGPESQEGDSNPISLWRLDQSACFVKMSSFGES